MKNQRKTSFEIGDSGCENSAIKFYYLLVKRWQNFKILAMDIITKLHHALVRNISRRIFCKLNPKVVNNVTIKGMLIRLRRLFTILSRDRHANQVIRKPIRVYYYNNRNTSY